ncbi:hypothetical protein BWQ93_08865 [Sphingopyxis sp. QXT-31]|nr:hypothetical protein BWQ93_08865 [Sphingopyxis sp. QXT-31]
MPAALARQLSDLVARHPSIASILRRWDEVALPDAWLTGSIVAQARWNERFGFDPHHGIADADIVYFDAGDLSAEAEERTEQRIAALFADLPVRVDVKNQARVHLWYAAKFGHGIAPYSSVADAIGTYPTTASAIGLRRRTELEVIAPFGLADLLRPVVRANAAQITEAYYETKTARWRHHWPDLEILPWSEAAQRP